MNYHGWELDAQEKLNRAGFPFTFVRAGEVAVAHWPMPLTYLKTKAEVDSFIALNANS